MRRSKLDTHGLRKKLGLSIFKFGAFFQGLRGRSAGVGPDVVEFSQLRHPAEVQNESVDGLDAGSKLYPEAPPLRENQVQLCRTLKFRVRSHLYCSFPIDRIGNK